MSNPVISIGVSGSGRYAPPDFSPIGQGMTEFGQALGGVFKERREKAEKEKRNAVLKHVFANAKGPADLLKAAQNDPSLLNDPRYGNFLRVMQSLQTKAAKQPNSVLEYTFAKKGGYKGSYADWMQRGKGSGTPKPNFKEGRTKDGEPVTIDFNNPQHLANVSSGQWFLGSPTDDRTTDDKNYASYKADQEARGLPVLPRFEWGQQRRKAGAASVTVNSGAVDKPLTGEQQRTIRVALGANTKLARLNEQTEDGRTFFEVLASPQAMIPRTVFGAEIPGTGYVLSDDFKKAESIITDVIADALYLKSGAQAGQSEIDGHKKIYMPQPGDGPKVIASKMRRLQEFAANARKAAGVNIDRWLGGGTPTPTAGGAGTAPPAAGGAAKPASNAERVIRHVTGRGKKPGANRPLSGRPGTPAPKAAVRDFTKMSDADLDGLDSSKLKGAEADAYIAELERRAAAYEARR